MRIASPFNFFTRGTTLDLAGVLSTFETTPQNQKHEAPSSEEHAVLLHQFHQFRCRFMLSQAISRGFCWLHFRFWSPRRVWGSTQPGLPPSLIGYTIYGLLKLQLAKDLVGFHDSTGPDCRSIVSVTQFLWWCSKFLNRVNRGWIESTNGEKTLQAIYRVKKTLYRCYAARKWGILDDAVWKSMADYDTVQSATKVKLYLGQQKMVLPPHNFTAKTTKPDSIRVSEEKNAFPEELKAKVINAQSRIPLD